MGRLILLTWPVLLLVGSALGSVWEFGINKKNSVVIATYSGEMSLFEKVKRIPFTVPPCHKVVYVRVDVENRLSSPEVQFIKDLNTVVIRYKLLQHSHSSFTVLVKAVPQNYCGQNKRQRIMKDYRPFETEEYDQDYDSGETFIVRCPT